MFVPVMLYTRNSAWVMSLLLSMFLLMSQCAFSQVGASAAISLSARLPGSITLNRSVIPISMNVENGEQSSVPAELEVRWNLDPRETQSFRVIAWYRAETVMPSSGLIVRVDDLEPRRVSATSRIVLFNVPITLESRRGQKQHTIEVSFETPATTSLPDGEYRGWLSLTTEQQ